jgi:DNA polymerase kappa
MVTKRINAILSKYEHVKHQDLSFEKRIVDKMIEDLEQTRDLTQCICHVDMDAFYASVEELENPELKRQPMAVGGMSMLCTSNYEARKYGVRSAMPGFIALKLCPQLKMIPLHFPKYIGASNKVRAVFAKYDPNFMPMSLDEVKMINVK